jgi:hypothetical protein
MASREVAGGRIAVDAVVSVLHSRRMHADQAWRGDRSRDKINFGGGVGVPCVHREQREVRGMSSALASQPESIHAMTAEATLRSVFSS